MTKEELFEAIQTLDDDTINKSEKRISIRRDKQVWLGIAMGIVLGVTISLFIAKQCFGYRVMPISKTNKEQDEETEEEFIDVNQVVDPALLYPELSSDLGVEEPEKIRFFIRDNLGSSYYCISGIEQEKLAELRGRKLWGRSWDIAYSEVKWDKMYYISGHVDREFMLAYSLERDEYTLLKFDGINSESYKYGEFATQIYGVNSPQQFEAIQITYPHPKNQDTASYMEYKIEYKDSISYAYELCASMIYGGRDNYQEVKDENDILYLQFKLSNGYALLFSMYDRDNDRLYLMNGDYFEFQNEEDREAMEEWLAGEMMETLQ